MTPGGKCCNLSGVNFSPKALVALAVLGGLFFAGAVSEAEVPPPLWSARAWETDDGLPDNNVTGVEQTPDGYLWVGTLGGLMRFNGSRFTEFSLQHLPNVANRLVRRMYLDHAGRLWLAMDRGSLACVSEKSAKVYTTAEGLPDGRVLAMAEDGNGTVWLAYSTGIFRIDGDQVLPVGSEEGVPPGGVPWLAGDGKGTIWLARGTHLGVIREGRWSSMLNLDESPVRVLAARSGGMWVTAGSKVFHYPESGKLELRGTLPDRVVVSALCESRAGVLWLGTEADGLFRVEAGRVERVQASHPEINDVMEDREGNLWVATGGGGLNLIRSQAMRLVAKKEGLPGEAVRSICEAADGEFWAAMNNGALARGHGEEWQAVGGGEGWSGGNATCVAAAKGGGVWIGTRDRGLQFLRAGKLVEWGRNQQLGGAWVRSLLVSADGDLWVATVNPNQLLRFRNDRFEVMELPRDVRSLRALAETADGTIWLGTADGQLLRVEGSRLVNETVVREPRPLSIRALHATPDGSLWIGYAGWGVGRFWNGHYARVTSKQGLHDDYVSQILSDHEARLWFTGNHGLFQVGQAELAAVTEGRAQRVRSIVCGKNEGLPGFQPTWDNSPAVCRTAAGQLWFATRNGLLTVQPERIADNPSAPPVVLEEVSVDDQPVALWNALSPLRSAPATNVLDLSPAGVTIPLAAGHRKLEFGFAALSFASPENVRFRHRLKNFDKEWSEAEPQPVARYPQLPAGEYEFQVQACNNAGVWNEAGYRVRLAVAPYFWQTWWFRTGALMVFAGVIGGAVRYFSFRRLRRKLERLEQQETLQRERARIARDMHDEVGSKLSRLTLLSEMAGQQPGLTPAAQAETMEISETARDAIRSFEEIVWAVNPKNDSLVQLMNYLCRFAEEFFEGSATQCVFDVPDRIPDIELPTGARHQVFLATKEALHNVFKHAQAGRVCVRLELAPESFAVGIEDDGRGFDPATGSQRAGGGNGLENMRERMRQVGGACEMRSQLHGGTRVTFRMPRSR